MWDVGCHIKSNSDNMNIFSIVDWKHNKMLQIHDKFEKKKTKQMYLYITLNASSELNEFCSSAFLLINSGCDAHTRQCNAT